MEVAYNTYFVILTIATLLALFWSSKLFEINLLRTFLVCTFFLESAAAIAAQFLGNNIIFLNVWIFISVAIFIKVVASRIGFVSKKYENLLLVFFICIYLINLLFWQGFNVYNTYSINIGSIIIMVLVLLHFKSLLDNPHHSIETNPFFWISSGLLIFYVGGFLVNTFMNFLIKVDYAAAKDIFIILNLLNCLAYSLFIIALYVNRRNTESNV